MPTWLQRYDRSFLLSDEYTPFLSQAPLTPEEWLQFRAT